MEDCQTGPQTPCVSKVQTEDGSRTESTLGKGQEGEDLTIGVFCSILRNGDIAAKKKAN
jgi:hypothetical protein